MVTGSGQPVEFFLTPDSMSDTRALKMYQFDVPEDALATGDKAYNDYGLEDMMLEANINFQPLRKKNTHRTWPSLLTYLLSYCRKVVETTGSLIERLLLKHVHDVTACGFELKIALFCIGYLFQLFPGRNLNYLLYRQKVAGRCILAHRKGDFGA
jgi:hypothetical protein